ncbi:MAG: hypothetical protein NTY16_02705 [Deltaproteobacteria bacterium]|nr:hypothetical protein [Deltaproteobacteria bacterium]
MPGCVLDIDSSVLGKSITGKDSRIKLMMAEHKEVVSEVSRCNKKKLPITGSF